MPEKSYRLKESRLKAQLHGFENTFWLAVIEHGTPYDEVLKPDFWAHVAEPRRMKIGDEIVVVPDDGSYRAKLFVRDVGRVWVKVEELTKKDFDAVVAPVGDTASEFRVEWKGPHHKHSVVRISDNEIIQGGFKSAGDARLWMAEHAKAMAA